MMLTESLALHRLQIFLFFARFAICDVGSEPIDRMQTSGVRGSDSAHVASKSKICISPYSGPRDSEKKKKNLKMNEHNTAANASSPSTYFFACEMVRSGLHERINNNLRKLSNVLLYEQGISSASGFSDSYHVFQSFSLASI